MSSLVLHLQRLLVFVVVFFIFIMTYFLGGCESCNRIPAERLGSAFRLTKGAFQEDEVSFHQKLPKLLLVRTYSGDPPQKERPDKEWDRKIFELDFGDSDYPIEKEIVALRGGSSPSYLGNNGIIALDVRGELVWLKPGTTKTVEIRIPDLSGRPTKPVASSDGEHIAFMAIDAPPQKEISGPPDRSLFFYKPYVISVKTGKAKKIELNFDKQTSLVSLEWTADGKILGTFQVLDPKGVLTRIEQIEWPKPVHRLALFADFPPEVTLDHRMRYFATSTAKPNNLTFITRDMSERKDIDLGRELGRATLSPDGNWVAISRFCPDTDGMNLFIVPVPTQFAESK